MSIRDAKGQTEDKIPVKNVLVSVFDKSGLETLVPGLIEANPDVRFMSTGGTYKKIKEMLGDKADSHLIEVAEYTGFPEMEGGLVKTLHPKIHAGLLGERNNPEHQEYIRALAKTIKFLDDDIKRVFDAEVGKEYRVQVVEGVAGVYIDMVVVNLYPFENVTAAPDVTFEKARGNIDIGGPTMLRAAAKNFLSCAAVCDPNAYARILKVIQENDGCTTFEERLKLSHDVFAMTAEYDRKIRTYIFEQLRDKGKIKACYNLEGE